MMKKNKTRNLSVAEYFIVAQKEYLIAEFRRKIYFNPNDKAYYQRVMNYKAEKINDIANRNRLDSILNNEAKMESMRAELFDKIGNPTFEMNENDINNYYSIGNDFSFRGEIWVLKNVHENGDLFLYSPTEGVFEVAQKHEVSRIL